MLSGQEKQKVVMYFENILHFTLPTGDKVYTNIIDHSRVLKCTPNVVQLISMKAEKKKYFSTFQLTSSHSGENRFPPKIFCSDL